MNIINTLFEGLFIIETNNFKDNRGNFQKLYNFDYFKDQGLDTDFKELYYSVSKKDVIRGMHFQTPPFDHTKLVYVSTGSIIDVVIDLRISSRTYLQNLSIELNAEDGKYLYIPKGFAHGFLSKENNTIVNYAQTSCYNKEHDCGILYNSIDFNWGTDNPIVSDRDLSFATLSTFTSPFK